MKDAAGTTVLSERQASIADVTQASLVFDTDDITTGSKRYLVELKACTGQGANCAGPESSNLAGIGEPRCVGWAWHMPVCNKEPKAAHHARCLDSCACACPWLLIRECSRLVSLQASPRRR